ncbi:Soluble inorganic pyrophosphatase [Platanthera guangdongensis]|uniref:inorganic diphosphatase n=1 Tax=Platanthera guangdongensis TaxID=2320717 RepID=A0ABR2LK98_9ASPA
MRRCCRLKGQEFDFSFVLVYEDLRNLASMLLWISAFYAPPTAPKDKETLELPADELISQDRLALPLVHAMVTLQQGLYFLQLVEQCEILLMKRKDKALYRLDRTQFDLTASRTENEALQGILYMAKSDVKAPPTAPKDKETLELPADELISQDRLALPLVDAKAPPTAPKDKETLELPADELISQDRLALPLVDAKARALDLDPDFFDKPEIFGEPIATLRLLHYEGKVSDPSLGIFGCGAHSDFGFITLLTTDDVICKDKDARPQVCLYFEARKSASSYKAFLLSMEERLLLFYRVSEKSQPAQESAVDYSIIRFNHLTNYLEQEPILPGCFLQAKAIGLMPMIDQGEKDDKIIVVCADDSEYLHYIDINELSPHRLAEIRRIFEYCILLYFALAFFDLIDSSSASEVHSWSYWWSIPDLIDSSSAQGM